MRTPLVLALALVGFTLASCDEPPGIAPFPMTGSHAFVGRFEADGSVDESFGRGGFVVTDFGRTSRAEAIAVDGQDRYFAAGSVETADRGRRMALVGYGESGQPNLRLGGGSGRMDIAFGDGATEARAIATRQVSGTLTTGIYLAGRTRVGDAIRPALARVVETGLDIGFGTGGRIEPAFPGLRNAQAHAVAVDAAQRMVVALSADDHPGFVLARYQPDGRLDGSFGTAGVVRSVLPGATSAAALALTIDTRGRHLVAGWVFRSRPGGFNRAVVARYDADGRLDTSFGRDGVWIPELAGARESQAGRPVLLDDGRIRVVLYGLFTDAGGLLEPRYHFAAASIDGGSDATFSSPGIVRLAAPGDSSARFTSIVRSGGRIVVGGHTGTALLLLGFGPDGTTDSGFGVDGVVRHPFPGRARRSQLLDVVVDRAGRFAVAGEVGF